MKNKPLYKPKPVQHWNVKRIVFALPDQTLASTSKEKERIASISYTYWKQQKAKACKSKQ